MEKVLLDVVSDDIYMLENIYIKEEPVTTLVNNYDGSILSYQELSELQRQTSRLLELLTVEQIEYFNESKRSIAHEEWVALNEGYFEEKRVRKHPVKNGYVYLIKEHFTHTYKIGRALDVANRANVFTVKLPFEWHFVATIESDDYIYLEEYLHRKFKSKRVNGEWFSLTEEDVYYITNDISNDTDIAHIGLKVAVE